MQGGVVAHVAVTPFPVKAPLELPHRVGDRVIEDVDDLAAFAPRVHHASVDRADTQSSPVRRLAPAAGVEGGLVQDDLSPGEVVFRTAYSSVNYKDALATIPKL